MKYLIALFTVVFVVGAVGNFVLSSDQTPASDTSETSKKLAASERVYPIAPGVWYPGQPMPDKPMRYYRVRCWPGCHSGSDYGKYPQKSLNMKPIHQTSALKGQKGIYQVGE